MQEEWKLVRKKKPEWVKETSIYFINAILFIKQIIWHILCNLCKLNFNFLEEINYSEEYFSVIFVSKYYIWT